MWVTGSVMWAAVNDKSLKFGVQGATATNWFPRVNGARDNRIWLYTLFALLTFRGEIIVKQDYTSNGSWCNDDDDDDDDDNNKDDDDDNRNNNNNDNDYNHNNDTNIDNNENDNDKNSSDSMPVTV